MRQNSMTEYNNLHKEIEELAQFLSENGHTGWGTRLRSLIGNPDAHVPVCRLRAEVRQLFGAMGSLTDIDIYFEGDPARTKAANWRLGILLDALFESVKDEKST
jgi:hypothetical protein